MFIEIFINWLFEEIVFPVYLPFSSTLFLLILHILSATITNLSREIGLI